MRIGILYPKATDLQKFPVVSVASTSRPIVDYFLFAYVVIVALLLINFLIKIYKLLKLAQTNKTAKHHDFTLVELPNENNAFSFFNYLFINQGFSLYSAVFQHEWVHIKQGHSWDIVYLELLKIVNWFNPIVYLLQASMKEVHEFIADAGTVNDDLSTQKYIDFLINNAYGINENTLSNTFFNKSLLKKRIMMLHQKRSGNAARLKYLLVLPLTGGLLCASTLAFTKDYKCIDLAPRLSPSEKTSVAHISGENKLVPPLSLKLQDTINLKHKLPPPPPEPPKGKKQKNKMKIPPPPPPQPPVGEKKSDTK
jgi:hypothetical protein